MARGLMMAKDLRQTDVLALVRGPGDWGWEDNRLLRNGGRRLDLLVLVEYSRDRVPSVIGGYDRITTGAVGMGETPLTGSLTMMGC